MFSGKSRITVSINNNLQNWSLLVEFGPMTTADLSVCNNKLNDVAIKKKVPKNLIQETGLKTQLWFLKYTHKNTAI